MCGVYLGPVGAGRDEDQPVIGQAGELAACGRHGLGAGLVGVIHDDSRIGRYPRDHGTGEPGNLYGVAHAQRVSVDPIRAIVLRNHDEG